MENFVKLRKNLQLLASEQRFFLSSDFPSDFSQVLIFHSFHLQVSRFKVLSSTALNWSRKRVLAAAASCEVPAATIES